MSSLITSQPSTLHTASNSQQANEKDNEESHDHDKSGTSGENLNENDNVESDEKKEDAAANEVLDFNLDDVQFEIDDELLEDDSLFEDEEEDGNGPQEDEANPDTNPNAEGIDDDERLRRYNAMMERKREKRRMILIKRKRKELAAAENLEDLKCGYDKKYECPQWQMWRIIKKLKVSQGPYRMKYLEEKIIYLQSISSHYYGNVGHNPIMNEFLLKHLLKMQESNYPIHNFFERWLSVLQNRLRFKMRPGGVDAGFESLALGHRYYTPPILLFLLSHFLKYDDLEEELTPQSPPEVIKRYRQRMFSDSRDFIYRFLNFEPGKISDSSWDYILWCISWEEPETLQEKERQLSTLQYRDPVSGEIIRMPYNINDRIYSDKNYAQTMLPMQMPNIPPFVTRQITREKYKSTFPAFGEHSEWATLVGRGEILDHPLQWFPNLAPTRRMIRDTPPSLLFFDEHYRMEELLKIEDRLRDIDMASVLERDEINMINEQDGSISNVKPPAEIATQNLADMEIWIHQNKLEMENLLMDLKHFEYLEEEEKKQRLLEQRRKQLEKYCSLPGSRLHPHMNQHYVPEPYKIKSKTWPRFKQMESNLVKGLQIFGDHGVNIQLLPITYQSKRTQKTQAGIGISSDQEEEDDDIKNNQNLDTINIDSDDVKQGSDDFNDLGEEISGTPREADGAGDNNQNSEDNINNSSDVDLSDSTTVNQFNGIGTTTGTDAVQQAVGSSDDAPNTDLSAQELLLIEQHRKHLPPRRMYLIASLRMYYYDRFRTICHTVWSDNETGTIRFAGIANTNQLLYTPLRQQIDMLRSWIMEYEKLRYYNWKHDILNYDAPSSLRYPSELNLLKEFVAMVIYRRIHTESDKFDDTDKLDTIKLAQMMLARRHQVWQAINRKREKAEAERLERERAEERAKLRTMSTLDSFKSAGLLNRSDSDHNQNSSLSTGNLGGNTMSKRFVNKLKTLKGSKEKDKDNNNKDSSSKSSLSDPKGDRGPALLSTVAESVTPRDQSSSALLPENNDNINKSSIIMSKSEPEETKHPILSEVTEDAVDTMLN